MAILFRPLQFEKSRVNLNLFLYLRWFLSGVLVNQAVAGFMQDLKSKLFWQTWGNSCSPKICGNRFRVIRCSRKPVGMNGSLNLCEYMFPKSCGNASCFILQLISGELCLYKNCGNFSKGHYATNLRIFACASCETIMLHHRAKWSNSAAQGCRVPTLFWKFKSRTFPGEIQVKILSFQE